ncbi:MAG: bifunctional folylpolyglutamate synthase/dihydrofolate synthase [Hyphomicrobiales bacterium]|nr:bifunctional folylpolyglutamate synthase/dihydrofolate synthase [Hyphomicrobiales bacterium]MDE2114810.1 bifunctional folylpolyglutamate synthase/dihydrofolate synthase [Hyphomicrobiales bacterium]
MTQGSAATQKVLDRLIHLHPKKIDLTLGRTLDLLAKLGNPQLRVPPVIHIAGTNGKGSTLAFLRAMLEASGKIVHTYTSPHLVRFNERIRLAGKLVSDDVLCEALLECERINAGAPVTFFESTTAAAFLLFSRVPADYLLLEVGLGGRFDSTNVIDHPRACVVTPVSMDHTEFLGTTIARIASEKAGIIKLGVPLILGPQGPEAFAVLAGEAQKQRAPMVVSGQDFHIREENGRLIYEDEGGLIDLPLPRLPGRHQFDNAATAIACLRHMHADFPNHAIEQGLANVQWPARLQRLLRGPLVDMAPAHAELWVDGGHNEDGGRVIAQAMADFEDGKARPLVLVCGTLASKDTAGFLRAFKGLAQEVVAVPVEGDHAARPAAEVAAAAASVGLPAVACASFQAALAYLAAREWRVPPRVLIVGSLYLAGEVLRANHTAID